MYRIIFSALFICATSANAQTVVPVNIMDYMRPVILGHNIPVNDSAANKKWFFTSSAGIATSISFFKGGHATAIAVPVTLQLNRRLNNNWYAFAAVSAAPAYINMFGNYGVSGKPSYNSNFMQPGNLGIYSKAELGLMYVNDAKTFSISGSIGIEKNNYPVMSAYPVNTVRPNPALPRKGN